MTPSACLPRIHAAKTSDNRLLDDDDPPATSLLHRSDTEELPGEPALEHAAAWPLLPRWIKRSPRRAIETAILLSLFVGLVDELTGSELQVMPLYLLPVGLATWIVGRFAGMFMAVLGAAIWLAGELLSGGTYAHPLIPYWNAGGMLVILAAVSWIVSRLHRAMHSLEEVVQQRTSALVAEMERRRRAEEARLQAERLAVVGTLSAQLAHEIRNPLGSITLNIDLLSQEIESLAPAGGQELHEARFLLRQLHEQILHLKHVTDSCMKLVRRPASNFHPVPLGDFLRGKLHLLQTELAGTEIHLTAEIEPQIPPVMTDGVRLWQALVNLLNNARQAMPQGGRLALRAGISQSHDEVQISVADTGRGIAPENLPRLYTPFFTTRKEGTGLGLVLVHQVVTELGGQIDCRSTPGEGTTFTISLPLTLPVRSRPHTSPPQNTPCPPLTPAPKSPPDSCRANVFSWSTTTSPS